MKIKKRRDLYNESRNKLKKYEDGEYYLCSTLELEGKEKWVRVDDILKEIKIIDKWHSTHRTRNLIKILENEVDRKC